MRMKELSIKPLRLVGKGVKLIIRKGCLPTLAFISVPLAVSVGWSILETIGSDSSGHKPPPGVIINAALTPGAVHATEAEATRAAEMATPIPDPWQIDSGFDPFAVGCLTE